MLQCAEIQRPSQDDLKVLDRLVRLFLPEVSHGDHACYLNSDTHKRIILDECGDVFLICVSMTDNGFTPGTRMHYSALIGLLMGCINSTPVKSQRVVMYRQGGEWAAEFNFEGFEAKSKVVSENIFRVLGHIVNYWGKIESCENAN